MKQEQTDGTELTQIKRHRKKGSEIRVSLSFVKQVLRQAKIKPVTTNTYNIYECGHAFSKNDDPSPGVVRYVSGVFANGGRGVRICPVCWERGQQKRRLVTKYKRCNCGAEHLGKHLQSSNCCSSCSSARRALKGATPKSVERANGHLADPDRCFCVHRSSCLIKYLDYEALPCKNCRRFKEEPWVSFKS